MCLNEKSKPQALEGRRNTQFVMVSFIRYLSANECEDTNCNKNEGQPRGPPKERETETTVASQELLEKMREFVPRNTEDKLAGASRSYSIKMAGVSPQEILGKNMRELRARNI